MAQSPDVEEKFALAAERWLVDLDGYGRAVGREFSSAHDAFTHYLSCGREASPTLFPFLEPTYYFGQFSEQAPANVTAFEHYVAIGISHGAAPIPLFDTQYILAQSPETKKINIVNFLTEPEFSSVDPHPLFSKRYYNAAHKDVSDAQCDPFSHFVFHGWRERRSIHPFFRAREYRLFGFPASCDASEFHRLLASALNDPMLGQSQPLFDSEYYAKSVGEGDAIEAPLQHYLTFGWRKNLSPHPLFDPDYYLGQNPETAGLVSPYVEYLSDFSHGFSPSRLLDAKSYAERISPGPAVQQSLLEHFVEIGAAEGVAPHPRLVAMRAPPSRYSGFTVAESFRDAHANACWLCTVDNDKWLNSCLESMNDIEPALFAHSHDGCGLNSYSSGLSRQDELLVSVVSKCARCNCLVISASELEVDVITDMLSPSAGLTSAARPWLTLICSRGPTVQYWHAQNREARRFALSARDDAELPAMFLARVAVESLPNKLVIRTDSFGVALLRSHAARLLGGASRLTLLLGVDALDANERQWLHDYIAMRHSELSSLILLDEGAKALVATLGLTTASEGARIINL